MDLKVGDTQQRKLTIMALKPCQNTLRVTFTNHKTHEFIYYIIVRVSSFLLTKPSIEPDS